MNPMWADVDTSESSHNHIFRLLLHPADSPEQRRKTRCSIFLLVNDQQRQRPTYPPPPASSSLTTIHNSSSSSPWDFFRLNPNLFSASSGLNNRNAGSEGGGYGYQRLQLHTFIFGGAHGGSTNSFLFSDSMRSFSDKPRYHRQSHSDIRSQPMPYTGDNNSRVPSPTATFRWRHYSKFQLFVPSKCQSRFPYRPATAILTPFTGTPLCFAVT